MKVIERIASRIENLKEDPQEWAEFCTDAMSALGVAIVAVVAIALMLWHDFIL